jgi:hypothetical protein
VQGDRKVMQFGQVRAGQPGYQMVSLLGELHPDHAGVGRIGPAAHEAGRLRPVHEFHHAVMAKQQVAGEIADGRRSRARMTLDRDQQLVLDMGQAHRASLIFAPSLKAAQADAKGEKVLKVLAGWLGQGCPPIGIPSAGVCGPA